MPSNPPDLQARLEQWREQGADRLDPLRFACITALAARAQRHHGRVRDVLDARLATWVEDYALAVQRHSPSASMPTGLATRPLQRLLEDVARAGQTTVLGSHTATTPVARSNGDVLPPVMEPAPLPALEQAQQLWSQVRIDSLLRQCLEAVPEDAGPLHSSVLLHRAMSRMGDVCPAYLQHFIAYADALSWLETLGGANNTDSPRSGSKRKGSAAGTTSRRRK